jgi:predicted transcriptional regulator of viral defense system
MRTRTISLRELTEYLLSCERSLVTLAEVCELTGLAPKQAADALAMLRRSRRLYSPQRGLYAAVPPGYRRWGVPPAMEFIDPMMAVMARTYYVGLLSAAKHHGVSQRSPTFQVIVDRQTADRDIGPVRLRFYTHSHIDRVPTQRSCSATGQILVSTPAATCLDLASRPKHAGGLSNVTAVLAELVRMTALSAERIVEASDAYPASSLRRLGWLLDKGAADLDLDVLAKAVAAATGPGQRPVTLLDPTGPRRGRAHTRWGIIENTPVEPLNKVHTARTTFSLPT